MNQTVGNFHGDDLSIIVPARNEALNIVECLNRITNITPKAEIIVVDGGNDSTQEVIKQSFSSNTNIKYLKNINDKGKGHAIQVGIKESRRKFIMQIDSDLQFFPEDIPDLIFPLIRNEADMVLGSRFEKESKRESGSTPFLRTAGNMIISAYASMLAKHKMTDILAGIKAWKREVTESYSLTSNNYSYEAELPLKAINRGWRVRDVAVSTAARNQGKSSVKIFRTGARLLKDIFLFIKAT